MTRIKLLGTAQDGGIPHLGCQCENCESDERRFVSCIAIIDDQTTLIDATPDIGTQTRTYLFQGEYSLGFDRIFLTHLHIGHYLGLLQLGKEVFSASHFPIHVSNPVGKFINANKPFSYLVERGEIDLIQFQKGEQIEIGPNTKIVPIEVSHRNEDGDTHGFIITGRVSQRKCRYLPDVDYLTDELIDLIRTMDIIIFDGSFWTKNELERQLDIPHPPMKEVIQKIGQIIKPQRFIFTHFNHSNPILNNSDLQMELQEKGYEIGHGGLEFEI
jgi:pyrroloquinoline quinone biosynthesis protein B